MNRWLEKHIQAISKSMKEKEFAIFCGAGISKNSGLPLANELKRYLLEKLSIKNKNIEKLMVSDIPFEAFIETISETTDISKILNIFKDGKTNTNHFFIARLARSSCIKTIFTTNFDLLIEKALEKEGLKKNKDFKVYYDEEQFSTIDFEDRENKIIRIFKIHGSIDHRDSVRTTMKAIANKTLSENRMNVIRNLFSTGNHKKVLILGYSCSDKFDITPQIQSVEENQKEIILVQHSKEVHKGVEDIKTKDRENPFRKFSGIRIIYNTNKFIKELWLSLEDIVGKYKSIKCKMEWKAYLDNWIDESDKDKALKYNIAGRIFCNNIQDFKKAIKYFEKSLEISREIEDKERTSRCYAGLGTAYQGLGNSSKAIEYYECSLESVKQIGDKVGETRCYINLGAAYYDLGDFKRTIEYCEKSLGVNRENGRKEEEEESFCYVSLGNAYRSSGNFKKAIEYYGKSLKIDREIGQKIGESRCYVNLGATYSDLGDFKKSIEYYEKSLPISKGIGDKLGESGCYASSGAVYNNIGNNKKAIKYFEKSLGIAKEIGNQIQESRCYLGLGSAYYSFGAINKAIKHYDKSLDICREIGDKACESRCYAGLGAVCLNLRDFRMAIEYYEKSLEIAKKIGARFDESKCYTNLGIVYYTVGNNKKAIEYYEKSLEISREIGDKAGESICLINLGIVYQVLGDYKRALKYYLISEKLLRELGEIDYLSQVYRNLSLAYKKIGNGGNAEKYKKLSNLC